MNLINPISAICRQECGLGGADNITMLTWKTMKCCFCQKTAVNTEHGCLIIYVHKDFECTALTEVKVPSSDGNIYV